jgi:hypothetical protein
MTILKRRICYGVACTVLVAAGMVALLPADRVLNGLPHKDIVEIQHMVRIEMWQFVGTMLSSSRIVHAPRQVWRSVLNRISPPYEWQDLSGQTMMINRQTSTYPQNTWLVITTQGDLFTVDKAQGHWRITNLAVKYAK